MGAKSRKTKSLTDVFGEYFELIDSYFRSIRHHLGEGEYSHIDLGHKIAGYPLISELFTDSIDDIGEKIYKFWLDNYTFLKTHVKSEGGLKCVYSGDISPLSLERFIKKTALYVDTVILPDPLLNLAYFMKSSLADDKFYLNRLIRHVFNVWKMKDLILAKTDYKIILIYPLSIGLMPKTERDSSAINAESQQLRYLATLFGDEFSEKMELGKFLRKSSSARLVFEKIRSKDILPNCLREFEDFDNFLVDLKKAKRYFGQTKEDLTPGELFGQYILSQFINTQTHKYFCDIFSAEPIYDHEPSWFFMNYNIGGGDIDTAILNALQREKLDWIGNIPMSVVSKLREEGELEYMRCVLREGILSVKAKKDRDLSATIKQLEQNFRTAFERQRSEIKNLESKVKKITKKNIPITIMGFLVGFIPYVSNFVSFPLFAKNLFGLFKQLSRTKRKIEFEEESTINLLMKSYEPRKE
jgi:hypothetical protein